MTRTYADFFSTPELLLCCPVYDTSNGMTTRVGSAVFVMPGIFITAKHVFEEWQARGENIERGYDIDNHTSERGLAFEGAVVHYSSRGRVMWPINKIAALPGYDVSILVCESAPEYLLKLVNVEGFPGTQIGFDLHPPLIGADITAMGFPDNGVKTDDMLKVPPEPLLRTPGEVEELYLEGAGQVKTAALHINNPVKHGMSGGPVLHDNHIVGLISSGIDSGGEGDPHTTLVSLLWEAFSVPVTTNLFGKRGEQRTLTLIEAGEEGFLEVLGGAHIVSTKDRLIWRGDAPNCPQCIAREALS